ncbi:hypothetical protein O1611_g1653 [Lasiodiplodia mahajangana]|uniref:Uncharacterized protein n=1 Tax=Lasiodiplodia mahajangana TaxID=1108764 RepID=A0ACC2JWU2_9PEZI|nr:hypothetical protein O1611_g1653 [Lasiodiplodia mahajangana]
MPSLREPLRKCHDGAAIDGDQPSTYNKIQLDKDSIQLRVDLGAFTTHSSPRTHTGHMDGCNDRYKDHYEKHNCDNPTQCPSNSIMSKAGRAPQQPLVSSSPETDERTGSSVSLTSQPSTTDGSDVPTLDFSKAKRPPHEYMHKRGGHSGFSMLSSTASPVL